MVMDPAIESHYGIGHERSRLFPGGEPTLEFVRSVELLERLLPAPPARVLDVGGGPGTYAAPLARRGYSVHLVDRCRCMCSRLARRQGQIRRPTSPPRWAMRESSPSPLNQLTRCCCSGRSIT